MQYIVIELQTDKDGAVANIVTKHPTLQEAESKYHAVLSAAAVSSVPQHAAVIIGSNGHQYAAKCYVHGEGA